jgi:hypothetical protein
MINVMQAHWSSVFFIAFTVLVTPFYWFLVLPIKKAIPVAWITVVVAAVMMTINLFHVTSKLGPAGGALIGLMWVIPPCIVWKYRAWFKGLDQKPIVGLQIFRLIGAFFIVEMFRGNIPSSFAWPAGGGDIIVGLFALFLFLNYKEGEKSGLIALIMIGLADFMSAFFFGFTSFEGPAQLFAVGFENQANLFPTGLIPFFLVPYAIVFHILSIINLKKKSWNGLFHILHYYPNF